MKLFVTGGCGFIGSNFIRHVLAVRPEMFIYNIDALTYAGNLGNLADLPEEQAKRHLFIKADISQMEQMENLFEEHQADAVVHFAAESHVDRSIYNATPFVLTNVLGTQILLDLARKNNVSRFVHVSTDEVYGSLGETGSFTEETPLAPNSPYSASKTASDLFVRAAYETFGYDTIITRCSNNYGPYQFPEKLIPLIIGKALQDATLPVYGTGCNVRDWIHVQDHCAGVLLALEKGKAGNIYNFGGASERTNLDVIHTILNLLGKPESLIRFVKDRPGHDLRYAIDFSKAAKELGFAPEKSFTQGLEQTVKWYFENKDWVSSVESGAYREFERQWYGAV